MSTKRVENGLPVKYWPRRYPNWHSRAWYWRNSETKAMLVKRGKVKSKVRMQYNRRIGGIEQQVDEVVTVNNSNLYHRDTNRRIDML